MLFSWWHILPFVSALINWGKVKLSYKRLRYKNIEIYKMSSKQNKTKTFKSSVLGETVNGN